MRTFATLVLAVLAAGPLAAQSRRAAPAGGTPAFQLRPFVVGADERFAAGTTFKAVFDSASQPLFGGGVEVAFRHAFVDLTISHLHQSGQRALLLNGQVYQLGIPLTVRLTPVELSGGYRLTRWRRSRVIPYAGAGVGWYSYHETSGFAAAGDVVDVRRAGVLVVAGAEFRVQKWIGATVDAQYTRVKGILGGAGLSKDAGEGDLGGIAARFRVVLGR